MRLEAKSENCFSFRFVLKIDGRPVGSFHGRWFGECLDINLTERRHLQFRKLNWIGSKFELVDSPNNQMLGNCIPSGFLSGGWDLNLSVGPGRLEKVGWLDSAYEFKQEAGVYARVDRLGWCERGW